MPRPERRLVEAEGRWGFLRRIYYATGISVYVVEAKYTVMRYSKTIPLYSVERLRYILGTSSLRYTDYISQLQDKQIYHYYNYYFVVEARRGVVVDWRGIP
ncbi:MAG: hypothetical protein QXP58_07065 [Thermoprotei archaeon]